MPLYMDLHHIDPNITQEDLDKAHIKDIKVQEKYGIKHKKYFVNFQEKTVFCLMHGPNKEAIYSSHAEVHGVGPCNVIEVSSLTPTFDFNTVIGDEGGKNRWDVALTRTGEIDTGFRTLMLIALLDILPNQAYITGKILEIIQMYDGNMIEQPNQKILVSFLHAQEGMLCLNTLQGYLQNVGGIEYNLAMVTSKPVDDTSSRLFENAINQLETLSLLGQCNMAYVDSKTKALYEKGSNNSTETKNQPVQFVSPEDFSLFTLLRESLEDNLVDANFRTGELGKILGFSKTQLYRRIKSLTGISPSGLILEVRLRHALKKLKNKNLTVSQIAYGQGFNSPNYFTRAFKKRFKVLPTEFANQFREKSGTVKKG